MDKNIGESGAERSVERSSYSPTDKRVLLTGATGFVGRHLYPVLVDRGYQVFCGTRDPAAAAQKFGDRNWIKLNVDDADSVERALKLVDRAVFLVHHLNTGAGYEEREKRSARIFASSAEAQGIEKIVYLGGVVPLGKPSRHLAGRMSVGRILRASKVPVVELRAAMIIGPGSASWNIVSDLAARLPAMILPRWLSFVSRPVAIDDVVIALATALSRDDIEPDWYNVPGPETVSHTHLIKMAAEVLRKKPVMFKVPLLSPTLSSFWIAAVTRTPYIVAREIVQGLQADLNVTEKDFFDLLPNHQPLSIQSSMRLAVADEVTDYPCPAAEQRMTRTARSLVVQAV